MAATARPSARPLSGLGSAGGSGCGGVFRARRPDPGRHGCAARDAHLRGEVLVRHSWPVRGREVVISARGPVASAASRRSPVPAAAHRAPRTRSADRRTRPGPRRLPTSDRCRSEPADVGGGQERLPPGPGGAAAGLAGRGPPSRSHPAAGCARRAARPHPGLAGGSGRGTIQCRRRNRGRTLLRATGRHGRA